MGEAKVISKKSPGNRKSWRPQLRILKIDQPVFKGPFDHSFIVRFVAESIEFIEHPPLGRFMRSACASPE